MGEKMKKAVGIVNLGLSTLLCAMHAATAAPTFTLGQIDKVPVGTASAFKGHFYNDSNIASLQFDIEYDPADVTIGSVTATTAMPNHTVSTRAFNSPYHLGFTLQRIVINPTTNNEAIPTGDIINIPITPIANTSTYYYSLPISNVVMSDNGSGAIAPSLADGGYINFEPKAYASPTTITTAITQDSYMYGTYNLTGNLTVAQGVTLEIKPGTQINLPQDAYFYNYGTVKLLGEANNPIVIKAVAQNGADRPWAGVVLDTATHNNEIRYTNIQWANIGIDVRRAWVTIDHAVIDNYTDKGISLTQGAGGTLSNNQIGFNNIALGTYGVYMQDTVSTDPAYQLLLTANQIKRNSYGVSFMNDTRAQVKNGNLITENPGAGVLIQGAVLTKANTPVLNVNQIFGNGAFNVIINAGTPADATPASPMVADLSDNYWGSTTIKYAEEKRKIINSIQTSTWANETSPRYDYYVVPFKLTTDPNDFDGDTILNDKEIKDGTSPYLPDTDGDGYNDNIDLFPKDPLDWADNDQDGIGDNADPDDDNDGMPDVWEVRWGLNPRDASDAAIDSDHDGVSNLAEYIAGTQPTDYTRWDPKDSDGDYLPDAFEIRYGFNPNKADFVGETFADSDGDNLNNYQELLLGTNPREKDTDNDGIQDDVDPLPLVNIPAVMTIIQNLLLN